MAGHAQLIREGNRDHQGLRPRIHEHSVVPASTLAKSNAHAVDGQRGNHHHLGGGKSVLGKGVP